MYGHIKHNLHCRKIFEKNLKNNNNNRNTLYIRQTIPGWFELCNNFNLLLYLTDKMDSLELDKEFNISNQEETYYHEYVRLYLANIALTSQVKELVEEKNQLALRLSKYEDDEGLSSYDRNHDRHKRFRRTAHEIQRFYKCSVKGCEKSYGSEGSLNQHYKIKHPEIYSSLPSVQSTKGPLEELEEENLERPKGLAKAK